MQTNNEKTIFSQEDPGYENIRNNKRKSIPGTCG